METLRPLLVLNLAESGLGVTGIVVAEFIPVLLLGQQCDGGEQHPHGEAAGCLPPSILRRARTARRAGRGAFVSVFS
jgi:hypothetical protein